MSLKNRNPLTPLEGCILLAHEAAALLNIDHGSLASAAELRSTLELLSKTHCLKDSDVLLTWIDSELDSARKFKETGKDTPHLIDPNRLIRVSDAASQLDVVWMLFQTSTKCTWDQRHMLLRAAETFAEMGGLDDMLLTTCIPDGGFLTAKGLHAELEELRSMLQSASSTVSQSCAIT